jgi:hypothetical protein
LEMPQVNSRGVGAELYIPAVKSQNNLLCKLIESLHTVYTAF